MSGKVNLKSCLMLNKSIMYEVLKTTVFHESGIEVEITWLTVCISKDGLFRIRLVNYMHSGPKVKDK